MKKTVVLFSALLLASCAIHAGDHSFWNERNEWIESHNTYPVEFFSQEPMLLKTDYVYENSRKSKEVLTTYTGYSMISSKTYQKNYYIADKVKAVMEGGLVGIGSPILFTKGESVPLLGQVVVDNTDFVLAPDKSGEYVVLVRRDGSVYPKIGEIRNNRLLLLDEHLMPKPDDFHFSPVVEGKTQQTKPVNGYDLRYEGIKNGKITMTYMVYNPVNNSSGQFETFAFPQKAGLYRINNLEIKILSADNDKIDFMVVKD